MRIKHYSERPETAHLANLDPITRAWVAATNPHLSSAEQAEIQREAEKAR